MNEWSARSEIEHLQCVKEIISSEFSFMPLAGELCNAIDKLNNEKAKSIQK